MQNHNAKLKIKSKEVRKKISVHSQKFLVNEQRTMNYELK